MTHAPKGRDSRRRARIDHGLKGGSSKDRGHSGLASTARASTGPGRSVRARAVRAPVLGPADQDRAVQARVDTGPARAPEDSDRKDRDRSATMAARPMVAGMFRGRSGAAGSPPIHGPEGHRKSEEVRAPARSPTTNDAPAISRVGPTAAFDRDPASIRARDPASIRDAQAASADSQDHAVVASDSGMTTPSAHGNDQPAPTYPTGASSRRRAGSRAPRPTSRSTRLRIVSSTRTPNRASP